MFLPYTANYLVNFGAGTPGGSSLSCPSELSCSTRPACPGWSGIELTADEPTVFTVKLGLSGGIRGYQSITGNILMKYRCSDCYNIFQDYQVGA